MAILSNISDRQGYELVIYDKHGVKPVLFYVGVMVAVFGAILYLLVMSKGGTFFFLGVALSVGSLVYWRHRRELVAMDNYSKLHAAGAEWSYGEVIAVVLAPERRDASNNGSGQARWRAWFFASSYESEHKEVLEELDDICERAAELETMHFDRRLESLGGHVFLEMSEPDEPASGAMRLAKHVRAPLFDLAVDVPTRLASDDMSVDQYVAMPRRA